MRTFFARFTLCLVVILCLAGTAAAQDDLWIKQVALEPNGGFVILHGSNGYTINSISDELEEFLQDSNDAGDEIYWVSFTFDDGWIASTEEGLTWNNIPNSAADEIRSIADDGDFIKWVTFSPDGGWVILFEFNGYSTNDVPRDLNDTLEDLNDDQREIRQVVFDEDGDWLVISDENGLNWGDDMNDDLIERLREGNDDEEYIYSATVNEDGDWVALIGTTIAWNGMSASFEDALDEALAAQEGEGTSGSK